MASRIQGITVEIGGDTTKLSKALESVNKSIKGTQSGLKDVNKLLKLDPSNTELVVQKQKMLKDAIEATKEKLATLKTAAQQANEQLANGEITQQQYDALQREIVETEQNLRSLQDQAATTNATLAKIDEAGEKLQNIGSSVENQQYGITILVSSHILDELSRLATHYGFIDNGKMIKEISADDLENSFRKSIRIEVTDGKALAAVLKQTGQPYKMPAPNVAEIYHRLNISQLTSALDKYHCDLLSIQEQEENLESYYVDLIGGVSHE